MTKINIPIKISDRIIETGYGSPMRISQLFRESNRDKILTARHGDTLDREDKQSESRLVMRRIVVATSPRVKTLLTFIWCLMAQDFLYNRLIVKSK